MKTCSRCRRFLPLGDFALNRRRPDGHQNNCRDCQRAYVVQHYAANTDYYLAKAKRSNAKRYAELGRKLEVLKDVPCTDCGRRYPRWVMDFDHVIGPKLFNVGQGVRGSLAAMLAEAAKCEVVCSNCHRERTWGRGVRP